MEDVTKLLQEIESGDGDAVDRLFSLVYSELRKIASARLWRDRNTNLQVTELVNESYLRLADRNGSMSFQNRKHFFGAASEAMRRILVDDARRQLTQKRGGGIRPGSLDEALAVVPNLEQVIAIDDALNLLVQLKPQAAKIIELRFFAGMTQKEAALTLGINEDAAKKLWNTAKTWLYRELRSE